MTELENTVQPQPVPEAGNPLMKKIQLPGKRFRLPSRGHFYNDGELADSVVNGEIEVLSMSSVDEISLRTPEFLFTGEAIERVFKRCIPEVKKPLKLLAPDVDFLLACLRIVSYGGIYEIKVRCPKCEERQKEENEVKLQEFIAEVETKAAEQNIDINVAMADERVQKRIETITKKRSEEHVYGIDLAGIVQNKTVEIDDEEFKKYTMELSNGQLLHTQPLKMDTSVAVLQFQNNENNINLDNVEEFLSFILASTVASVDGINNREQIDEWAKALPIGLKREIDGFANTFEKWGTDFSYIIKCKNEKCGHEQNISTLLNPINFFMTPSEQEEQ